MEYIQDNIKYKIEDNILKGWKGKSPFKKPFWNGTSIEESFTQADQDKIDAKKTKEEKVKKYNKENVVIWQGKSVDGLRDLVLSIDSKDKLKVIEIK